MYTCANVTGGMILLGAPALGEVVGMAEAAGDPGRRRRLDEPGAL